MVGRIAWTCYTTILPTEYRDDVFGFSSTVQRIGLKALFERGCHLMWLVVHRDNMVSELTGPICSLCNIACVIFRVGWNWAAIILWLVG